MANRDRLSSLILEHWTRYHPSMLFQLQLEGRLQEELEKTADQFTDLLYELVAVKGMEYHQAWELTVQEFLLPEESSSRSQTPRPEISGSAMHIKSGWAARMRRRSAT
jgi:hypothetical protein